MDQTFHAETSETLSSDTESEATNKALHTPNRICPGPADDSFCQAAQNPPTESRNTAASAPCKFDSAGEPQTTSSFRSQDPSARETDQSASNRAVLVAPRTPQKPGALLLNHLKKHALSLASAYSWSNRSFINVAKERARNLTGFYLMISTVRLTSDENYFCSKETLSDDEKNCLDDAAEAMLRHGFFEDCLITPESILFRFRKFERKYVVDQFFLTGAWLEAFAYGAIDDIVRIFLDQAKFELYADVIVENADGRKHEYDAVLCVDDMLLCVECKAGGFDLEYVNGSFDFMRADLGVLVGSAHTIKHFNGIWDRFRIAVCSNENFSGAIRAVVKQAVQRKNLLLSDPHFYNKLQEACTARHNSAGQKEKKGNAEKRYRISGHTFSHLKQTLLHKKAHSGKLLRDYLDRNRLEILDILTWKYDGFNKISKEIASNPLGFRLLTANARTNPDGICFCSKEDLSDTEKNSLDAAIRTLSTQDFFDCCQNTADSICYRFRDPETASFILTGKWLQNFAGCGIAEIQREIGNRIPCEFYTNLIVRNRQGKIHEYDMVLCVKDTLIGIECLPGTLTSLKGVRGRFEFLNVPAGKRVILGTGLNIDETQKQNIWKQMRITSCSPKDFRSTIKNLAMHIDEPEPLCLSDEIPPGQMLAASAAKDGMTALKATRLAASGEKISYVAKKLAENFSDFSRLDIDGNPDSSSVFCDTSDLDVNAFDRLKKLLGQLRDCGLIKSIKKTEDGITASLTSLKVKAFFQGEWLALFAYQTATDLMREFGSGRDLRIECYGSVEVQNPQGERQEYPITLLVNGAAICVYCAKAGSIPESLLDAESDFLKVAKLNRLLLAPGLAKEEASAIKEKYHLAACEIRNFKDLLARLVESAARSEDSISSAPETAETRQTNKSATVAEPDETRQTDAAPQFVADDIDPQAPLLDIVGHEIEKRYEAIRDFVTSAADICAEGLCLQDIYPESDYDMAQNNAISYAGSMLRKAGILSDFSTDRRRREYRYSVNPDPRAFSFLCGGWFKHAALFLFSRQGHIDYDMISSDLMVKTRHGAATIDLVLKIGDNAVYAKTAVAGCHESALELAGARAEIRNAGNASFFLICLRISDGLKKALEAKHAIKICTLPEFEAAMSLMTRD